jgi:hypothetical protein
MPDARNAQSAAGSTTAGSDRATRERPTVAEALRDSGRSFAEIAQYAGYFIAAKIDQIKLSVRSLILYALLGVLGAVAAAAVLIVAVVLLLMGIADGIGYALGGRVWLGDLIVGLVVIGAVAGGLGIFVGKFNAAARLRTVQKYEDRLRQQRDQFGHDIGQRQSH